MGIGKILPKIIRESSFYASYGPAALRARALGPRAVFSSIYSNNKWGGTGEAFSGTGSRGAPASEYVSFVKGFIQDHAIRSVVDIGCGDYFIGRQIAEDVEHYVGIDVVQSLIDDHSQRYGDEAHSFVCLDVASEPIPMGDLCLIRQVLQHMSNRQIAGVLEKVRAFKYALVTEHYAHDDDFKAPNLNKAMGTSTRLSIGSMVAIDQPPYNMKCEEVLRVPAPAGESEDRYSRGTIRTFLYCND